ncbi:MAG: HEAT repeat domain-containing protein [Spirulinaceae cyanobacterium SM2_1_0]|nr:HEAT repeat domain-containing protein [Spirulinaceae cyanobacterium SM2_1_0]
METIFAILLGGACLVAVITAGLRRRDREQQAVIPPTLSPSARLQSGPLRQNQPAPAVMPDSVTAPIAASPRPAATPPPASIASPSAAAPTPDLPAVEDRELADLIAWGQSGQTVYLSLLSHYRYHPSAAYRCQTAIAIGAIAVANPPRHEVLQAVDTLAQLSGDGEREVRQAAVAALTHIRDARVVPLLQRALRDSDGEVIRTASEAIARFKNTRQPRATKPAPARRPDVAPKI